MIRTFASFILVVGVTGSLCAEEKTPSLGDDILLTMRGRLAKEYFGLASPGSLQTSHISSIQTRATVVQVLDGGYRINHFSAIQDTGEPLRIVSISTIIEASQLKTETTTKNTADFSSFSDIAPATSTPNEHECLTLVLSEIKGVRFQRSESEIKGGSFRTSKFDVEFAN